MSNINDGGPAFPNIESDEGGWPIYTQERGMSLRDYFAAKVMQGLCSNAHVLAASKSICDGGEDEVLSKAAYQIADAMLIEREKGGGK